MRSARAPPIALLMRLAISTCTARRASCSLRTQAACYGVLERPTMLQQRGHHGEHVQHAALPAPLECAPLSRVAGVGRSLHAYRGRRLYCGSEASLRPRFMVFCACPARCRRRRPVFHGQNVSHPLVHKLVHLQRAAHRRCERNTQSAPPNACNPTLPYPYRARTSQRGLR